MLGQGLAADDGLGRASLTAECDPNWRPGVCRLPSRLAIEAVRLHSHAGGFRKVPPADWSGGAPPGAVSVQAGQLNWATDTSVVLATASRHN